MHPLSEHHEDIVCSIGANELLPYFTAAHGRILCSSQDRAPLSTTLILGFIFSKAAFSFSDGVKPYFSSTRSDRNIPTVPQATRPTPTPSLALCERLLYALVTKSAFRVTNCNHEMNGYELKQRHGFKALWCGLSCVANCKFSLDGQRVGE